MELLDEEPRYYGEVEDPGDKRLKKLTIQQIDLAIDDWWGQYEDPLQSTETILEEFEAWMSFALENKHHVYERLIQLNKRKDHPLSFQVLQALSKELEKMKNETSAGLYDEVAAALLEEEDD